jgi:hypothetical protein
VIALKHAIFKSENGMLFCFAYDFIFTLIEFANDNRRKKISQKNFIGFTKQVQPMKLKGNCWVLALNSAIAYGLTPRPK